MDLVDRAAALASARGPAGRNAEAQSDLKSVRDQKERAIDNQDFERAAALRDREKAQLVAIAALEKDWVNMPDHAIIEVTEGDVTEALPAVRADAD
jgi:ATP-dependent Clp protease ATP-binding subunit ClpC